MIIFGGVWVENIPALVLKSWNFASKGEENSA